MCKREMTADDLAQVYRQFMRWEDIDNYLRLYAPAIEADTSSEANDLRVGYMVLRELIKCDGHSTYVHMQLCVCAELIWKWEHKDDPNPLLRTAHRVIEMIQARNEWLIHTVKALIDAIDEYESLASFASHGGHVSLSQLKQVLSDVADKAREQMRDLEMEDES